MAEEENKLESAESLEENVSSFASGLDYSLAKRLEEIKQRQSKELETLRREVLIAKTLFEVETKRALDGADEKTVLALAKSYRDLDLGDGHE